MRLQAAFVIAMQTAHLWPTQCHTTLVDRSANECIELGNYWHRRFHDLRLVMQKLAERLKNHVQFNWTVSN